MLSQAADLAKDARLKIAPVVQVVLFSWQSLFAFTTRRVVMGNGPYAEEWFKNDGLLKTPLRLNQGSWTSQASELDTTKFQSKQIAAIKIKDKEG